MENKNNLICKVCLCDLKISEVIVASASVQASTNTHEQICSNCLYIEQEPTKIKTECEDIKATIDTCNFEEVNIKIEHETQSNPLPFIKVECNSVKIEPDVPEDPLRASYKCDICHEVFELSEDLKAHCATHRREENQCDICRKYFSTSAVLKSHRKIHTGEQPFKCNFCERPFSRATNLKKHKRIHVCHPENFKCYICGEDFRNSSDLKGHLEFHTGEFKCGICGRKFDNDFYLKYHQKIHEPAKDRPHKCDVCPKVFLKVRGLKLHLKTHAGVEERPFKCNLCDKSYIRHCKLKMHMQVHISSEENTYTDEKSLVNAGNDFYTSTELRKIQKHTEV